MKKQTIIFDLDDTLSSCNEYYVQRINQFTDVMLSLFPNLKREEIMFELNRIDIEGVKKYGLSAERFPLSFVETYQMISKKENSKTKKHIEEKVYDIANSVYDVKVEPYDSTYRILDKLQSEGHKLCLYTGGEEDVQMSKVDILNLHHYFEDRIFITKFKEVDFLKKVLEKLDANIKKTWMIGNSLRTDIAPAVKAGINAIHIPGASEWDYNSYDVDANKFLTIDSLDELSKIFNFS